MIKKSPYYLLSFVTPLIILAITLATQNIWWNSDTTILASDGFHQYVIFTRTLRDILHGKDSLFYSFSSGLGINFYALISYYLGSFLSPLVYFFDVFSMPDALYLMTLIKVGLIGLSSFTSLSSIHRRVDRRLILVLSSSLALMSFSMGQIEINMWLDVFILVPMVILGLHKLLTQRRYWLYFTSLSILFIQNYYFGFMTAIFISLWFLAQLSWEPKQIGKKFLDFSVLSLLAGMTSSIMLLPTYLDLKTHGESLTSLSRLLTENSWYLDSFAKNMVGAYDTTKFGSIPTIYAGIFPLILALTFFTIKAIKWPIKLAHALLIMVLLASFYLEPLDLFWQGMHAPNMFLHRYSWVFSVLVVYLAGHTLDHLDQLTIRQFWPSLSFLGLGYGLTMVFKDHYDFLTWENMALTACFFAAYAIILLSYCSQNISKSLYIGFTLCFTLLELGLNGYYQLSGLGAEWHFPSREGYSKDLTAIDSLVKQAQGRETDFYRMERLAPQTGNDSMKYGYNGISQFSSVRNRKSSQLLDKLGFRSDGTNLNLRYQNNTLIADSLFAVRYNLHDQTISKYGFDWLNQEGQTHLYHNRLATSLAILTPKPYENLSIGLNTLDNQANFLNQLAGLNLTYFKRLATTSPNLDLAGKRLTTTPQEDGSASAELNISVLANSQVYLSLPHLTGDNTDRDDIRISIDGVMHQYSRDNAFTLFNLGYYPEDRQLTIQLFFPETDQVSFNLPNVYALDTQAYELAMTSIKAREPLVTTEGNRINISYQTPETASLLVTLPYDKGWSAQQDGQKLPITPAQDGLILLDAKVGGGDITLTFVPNGFWPALGLSASGLVGFLIFNLLKRQQEN